MTVVHLVASVQLQETKAHGKITAHAFRLEFESYAFGPWSAEKCVEFPKNGYSEALEMASSACWRVLIAVDWSNPRPLN